MTTVDAEIDLERADRLARALDGVRAAADGALTEREQQTLADAIAFLEEAAGIETGERCMDSPVTGETYRVTRWIDLGQGNVIALEKEPVDSAEGIE